MTQEPYADGYKWDMTLNLYSDFPASDDLIYLIKLSDICAIIESPYVLDIRVGDCCQLIHRNP